jgi:cytochrome c2
MKHIIAILAAAILCGTAINTFAADAAKGKAVHDAKCMGCHDTHQYTRPNRIIHTLEDLHARVEFCDSASSAGFTPDDIDNVVAYLNTTFYKFPTK